MSATVWLEVALNGPWSRERQPNIPVSADEIVEAALACVGESAAIVHFHAYDEATGRQRDDYEIYAPIIERIRSRCDAICCGTLPFLGSPDAARPITPEQRFGAVDKLVRAGLVEWSVVDPGSTNISHYTDIARGREGFVYANPESHVRYGLELALRDRITPSFAIYEAGFMRLGAALHRQYPGAPIPVYRLIFSDGIAFGFPPHEWALDAYLRLLALEHPGAPWIVAGLAVDIAPLIDYTVARGGMCAWVWRMQRWVVGYTTARWWSWRARASSSPAGASPARRRCEHNSSKRETMTRRKDRFARIVA